MPLASPDVPFVSSASVAPTVALFLSAVNVPGVSAVVRVSALVPLMLWASVLLPAFPLWLICIQLLVFAPVLAPLLLLAFLTLLASLLLLAYIIAKVSAVAGDPCCCCRPALL